LEFFLIITNQGITDGNPISIARNACTQYRLLYSKNFRVAELDALQPLTILLLSLDYLIKDDLDIVSGGSGHSASEYSA
jgi:hypothetical protein